jgi:uncharacterized membrane protein YidH (DUF202 family)
MLRYLVGSLHVAVGDAAVEDMVRKRLARAVERSGGKLEVPERTIQAWVRAALAIHHANRDLYRAVVSGDFV